MDISQGNGDHILKHTCTHFHTVKFDSLTFAIMTCWRLSKLSHVWQTFVQTEFVLYVGEPDISMLVIAYVSKNLELLHSYSPPVCSCYQIWLQQLQLSCSQPNSLRNLNTAAFTVWIELTAADQIFHKREVVSSPSLNWQLVLFQFHFPPNILKLPQLPLYSATL